MNLHLSQRVIVLASLAVVVGILVSGWSYGRMSESRAVTIAAADDLAACHRMARQIRALRHKPSVAGSHEPQQNELTRRIEQSARQARIPAQNLDRIWPEPARYIGDTPYKKHATEVVLRGVTLQQIVTLMHTLESQGDGPRLSRIRLAAPRDKNTTNHWTAEATLTYLVYAPRVKANEQSVVR